MFLLFNPEASESLKFLHSKYPADGLSTMAFCPFFINSCLIIWLCMYAESGNITASYFDAILENFFLKFKMDLKSFLSNSK